MTPRHVTRGPDGSLSSPHRSGLSPSRCIPDTADRKREPAPVGRLASGSKRRRSEAHRADRRGCCRPGPPVGERIVGGRTRPCGPPPRRRPEGSPRTRVHRALRRRGHPPRGSGDRSACPCRIVPEHTGFPSRPPPRGRAGGRCDRSPLPAPRRPRRAPRAPGDGRTPRRRHRRCRAGPGHRTTATTRHPPQPQPAGRGRPRR